MLNSDRRWGSTFLLALCVYVTVAVLFACAAQLSPAAMPSSSKDVLVTEKDHGTSVVLAPGTTLVVKLESQLGTGYGWEVEDIDTSRLESLGPPVLEVPAKPSAGGREFQIFRFQPVKPGAVVLKLRYLRSWEKPPKPTKTFTLRLTIGA